MALAPITTTLNPTNEGYIIGPTFNTFGSARNTTNPGTAYNITSSTSYQYAIQAISYSLKGQFYFRIHRTFLRFDTSSIDGTVSSATLKVAGVSSNTADVIVVKSDAFNGASNALAGGDFDNLDYSTPYSSEISTWNLNLYNNIALNTDAKVDIENENVFRVALIEHDHDYLYVQPSAGYDSGVWFQDGTFPIELSVTYTPSGFGGSVNTVDGANIANINTVDLANISSMNTVDFT